MSKAVKIQSNISKRVLIIPDCHHPFVDENAWQLLLSVCAEVKFDVVIILGDFLDLASLSFHPRRLPETPPTLAYELEAGNKALDDLDRVIPKEAEKVYCLGNHEDRLNRYLAAHAELTGFVSVEEKLQLRERGFKVTPYHHATKFGKLWISHDCGNAGANAHSQALQKTGRNIIIGHTHRMGYVVRGNIENKPQLGVMFGWLGDKSKIEYRSQSAIMHEWALGFGVGLMDSDGVIFLDICPIVDGRVKVYDKIYKNVPVRQS